MKKVMRVFATAAVAAFLAMGATACGGDVCEDAAELCGAEGNGDGEGECTGAAETYAQCIVDAGDCSAETVADCAGTGG